VKKLTLDEIEKSLNYILYTKYRLIDELFDFESQTTTEIIYIVLEVLKFWEFKYYNKGVKITSRRMRIVYTLVEKLIQHEKNRITVYRYKYLEVNPEITPKVEMLLKMDDYSNTIIHEYEKKKKDKLKLLEENKITKDDLYSKKELYDKTDNLEKWRKDVKDTIKNPYNRLTHIINDDDFEIKKNDEIELIDEDDELIEEDDELIEEEFVEKEEKKNNKKSKKPIEKPIKKGKKKIIEDEDENDSYDEYISDDVEDDDF
jgi:hypothetical protein